jgi:hypothetical protein
MGAFMGGSASWCCVTKYFRQGHLQPTEFYFSQLCRLASAWSSCSHHVLAQEQCRAYRDSVKSVYEGVSLSTVQRGLCEILTLFFHWPVLQSWTGRKAFPNSEKNRVSYLLSSRKWICLSKTFKATQNSLWVIISGRGCREHPGPPQVQLVYATVLTGWVPLWEQGVKTSLAENPLLFQGSCNKGWRWLCTIPGKMPWLLSSVTGWLPGIAIFLTWECLQGESWGDH